MKLKTIVPWGLLASCMTLAGSGVLAETSAIEAAHQAPMLLAGEIILGPARASSTNSQPSTDASNAARQKKAARDYRKEQAAPQEVIVVPEEEEGGILSPRQAPSGASESVARARDARQGDTGSAVVPAPTGTREPTAHPEEAAALSAQRNRAKAMGYRAGDRGTSVAVKGSDNLPIVDCSNVDNVSGRIGDDTRSGSVITLIQGSNQIKVRCR